MSRASDARPMLRKVHGARGGGYIHGIPAREKKDTPTGSREKNNKKTNKKSTDSCAKTQTERGRKNQPKKIYIYIYIADPEKRQKNQPKKIQRYTANPKKREEPAKRRRRVSIRLDPPPGRARGTHFVEDEQRPVFRVRLEALVRSKAEETGHCGGVVLFVTEESVRFPSRSVPFRPVPSIRPSVIPKTVGDMSNQHHAWRIVHSRGGGGGGGRGLANNG